MKYEVYTQQFEEIKLKEKMCCGDWYHRTYKYRLLPWSYDATVDGTKELYKHYGRDPYTIWVDRFDYEPNKPVETPPVYCVTKYHRAIVVDEKGNIRNYKELTKKWKRPIGYGYCGGNHWYGTTGKETRRFINTEDAEELARANAITVSGTSRMKKKRDYAFSDPSDRYSRNWKKQTKKKKQYGKHTEKLSRTLFDMDCEEAELMEKETDEMSA